MARKIVGVRLSVELEAYIRAKPDATEWLRRIITEAIEKERLDSATYNLD